MNADGSIVISMDLDNKKLEQKLSQTIKKIEKLEETIYQKRRAQSPLLEEAKQLGIEYDRARKKLEYMRNSGEFFTSAHVAEQAQAVRQLEADWDRVRETADKYAAEIYTATQELDRQKEAAGEIVQQVTRLGNGGSSRMGEAINQAGAYLDKFTTRIKALARQVFIFTLIPAAFKAIQTWMGTAVKTNADATAAIAKLKGALLTMVQPLIDIVVPAFTILVNILTRVISTIAQLFAMLTGRTIDSSKTAASALYNETEALEGTGAAAEEAQGALAGFDEINALSSEPRAGGGTNTDVAPDFNFEADLTDGQLKNILALVETIGTALLAWRLGKSLNLGLEETLGLGVAIYSAIQFVKNLFDAWTNGVDWSNLLGMLASAAGIAVGLGIAFGPVAAGISLIVTGLLMLATGFHDAMENGWNLENMLLSIAGILATGIGIAILTGSFIPVLIAAIAGVLLALTVAFGHGEELLEGVKTILQGFIDFFVGIFTGNIDQAVRGVGEIFSGLKESIGAILDSLRDAFSSFLDWLDEKTGGKFHGIIEFFRKDISDLITWGKEFIGSALDALQQAFGGLITFLSGVFTADWDKAWEGLVAMGKGAVNLLISAVEAFVNFFARAINNMIDRLNNLSFTVPDWVPLIGGSTFGFNIPKIPELQIPRLAAGAVVPPNREFMAVLGDNKAETEVVSPLSTMKQAMLEAMQEGGFGGEINITIVTKLDGQEVARNQVKHINNMTRAAGKPVLLL